jgi:hypothetical protein
MSVLSQTGKYIELKWLVPSKLPLAVLTCIQEVVGSKLGQDINYPSFDFS